MIETKNATPPQPGKIRDLQLTDLLDFCKNNGFALAVWRQPGKEIQGIIDTGNTHCQEIDLESSEPGYLFHPFSDKKIKHFIRAQIRFTVSDGTVAFDPYNKQQHKDMLRKISSSDSSSGLDKKMMIFEDHPVEQEKPFIELVKKAIKEIRQGHFQKVVPSRIKAIRIEGFDLKTVFQRLIKNYPNAFVSATFVPEAGLWIGASPEILVNTEGKRIFQTVALAGTQSYDGSRSLQDIAWTQKEIEEQAYVSRYIINCFKKIRLREFDEIGPKTIIAGKLIHLKTTFRVDMEAVNFPQLGTVMMKLLHPTSAVCGMPLETASAWLEKNEGYDREFFSGFLGPVNLNENTNLYVNLRCMKLIEDKAWVYAGAGVTEDSHPEKEWMETSIKMNTLLDVIH
ncbi:chorismate-binding protein [Fulvivirga sedimenti]|uniref:Chorismate-binding protein n=1 Tax=Fulvivirga sedimenti TaxID=2879465 RepID=A0A9X1HMH4_9BACT|nr:chorismate-binding protein [Fulvivirga sedimenti]MCA6073302.1 chorismate-binding protein [Fulvivirga sedimenti]